MAIWGIEGGIGSGKTLTLVYLLLQDHAAGKNILANIAISKLRKNFEVLDRDTIHNMFERVKEGHINLENSTIGIQEMHNYIDSRNSSSTRNKLFSYFILQSRHTGRGSCDIIYDTQSTGQVDIRLRNNTDLICQPQTFFNSKKIPVLVAVSVIGYVGVKRRRFNFQFDPKPILNRYSTYELVDF